MRYGGTAPDLPTFRVLARDRRVIPVTRRLLADGETPVGLYRKLAGERTGTFLLESAEHGRVWSRYSIVGARSAAMLTERGGQAHWFGTPPVGLPHGGEPLAALRDTLAALHTPRHSPALPELPPLTGGLVGYIGYDAVRRLERLPELAKDELALPELAMLLATDLAVLDHADGSVLLVANAINWDNRPSRVDEAHADAVTRLDRMTDDLGRPAPATVATLDPAAQPAYARRTERADYLRGVEQVKEEIRAGEAFQVVLSQRFDQPTSASALDIYRVLRLTNPSPYMYLLRLGGDEGSGDEGGGNEVSADDGNGNDGSGSRSNQSEGARDAVAAGFDIIGSSPEALVKVTEDRAMLHPIAGTRPRDANPEADAALAAELLADPKERAEHVMLVDLGRNDLGRVCEPGSVEVLDFLSVERYSHVMHLVSTVVGRLRPGRSALDVVTACFPAGTLSGAPKPRAMEIIEELEPSRRGLYGGIVGYLDFAGDADTAIAIRTALLRDGVAHVQAGAGIVADSDPASEDAECRSKAAAVLRAVAAASTLAPVGPRSC